MAILIKSNGISVSDYNASTVEKIKSAIKGSPKYVYISNGNIIACNDEAEIMGMNANTMASQLAGMPVYGDALLINKFEIK